MTMDEIFKEALKQSPTLGLMLTLVMAFLRHVKDITSTNAETQKMLMASHAKRTDEFIEAVREMKLEDRASRDRNSEALTNLGTEITRLSAVADQHRRDEG
jgi:hypothetical protein